MYASLFFFTINFIKFIHKSHFYARVVIHETYFNQSDVFKGPTRLTTELVYGHHAARLPEARSQKPKAKSRKQLPKCYGSVVWWGPLIWVDALCMCVTDVEKTITECKFVDISDVEITRVELSVGPEIVCRSKIGLRLYVLQSNPP